MSLQLRCFTAAVAAVLVLSSASVASAQTNAPAPPGAAESKLIPSPTVVKVTIVLARLQGTKKISNLPFVVFVPTGDRVNLRVASQVPRPTKILKQAEGSAALVQSYEYQNAGTNFDVMARATADGKFVLNITMSDTSAVALPSSTPGVVTDQPVLQTFTTQAVLVLRDAQTLPFMTATDSVTGDTIKIDVSLDVVK